MNRDDETGICPPRKPYLSVLDRIFLALAERRVLAPSPYEQIGVEHLWRRYKPRYLRQPATFGRLDRATLAAPTLRSKDLVARYARNAEDIRMGALRQERS